MKNIIIIFGLTGSGKSTMANMLGKKLGLRVVHPSSILRDLLTGKKPNVKNSQENKGFWESSGGTKLFKHRLKVKQPLDFICDKILLKEISKGGLVMDSWTMPWLSNKGMKICLKATMMTRSRRVARRSGISIKTARAAILLRDTETRNLYKSRFDIKKDNQVFDLVIKTDDLSQDEVLQVILKKFYEKDNFKK